MITCSNCSKENPGDAKFCQNCGHSLEKPCPHCQTRNAATAKFCKNCGRSLSAESFTPQIESPQEEPEGITTSERRFVTILFCDVSGSTSMGELLDPEEWTEIMNGMFERLIPPITRYDGTVARLMGDAVLALFGAPVAHEDDPYRAILTAVDMQQDIRPYQDQVRKNLAKAGVPFEPSDLDVRIGINTGLAIVGEVGSGEKREYTAMGDAVNLAARMEKTAVPGTIQITHDTYQAVNARVNTQALDPLHLKGKREPVQAYRVLGLKKAQDNRRNYGQLQAPLIGRNQEMNQLAGALSRLQAGHGQIICLIGEGGIGKSRLVKELSILSNDFQININWYLAESYSFEGSQPYGLFQRLLRRVGDIARDDSPQTASQKITLLLDNLAAGQRRHVANVLATLFGLESAEGQTQPQGEDFKRELFEGVRALAQAWATAKPTVLVFEDLHWTDPASVELISHILSLANEVPLLLVCVFRPYASSPAWAVRQRAQNAFPQRYQEIELKPLTIEAGNHLVGNLLNIDELPETIVALMAEKGSGVPYFIEEIVRDLIERGVLVCENDSQAWQLAVDNLEIEIPDTLEAVLVSRMDRLDSDTRGTLQLAAVIGRSFYYRVLKMIAGDKEQLKQHIVQLQQVGMILEFTNKPELQYIFRHVLAQEAAYNTILFRRRRQYHRLVGKAMEEIFSGQINEQAPLLAYHFQQAGDDQRALQYYTIAAENAARLYANEEAVNHYSKALEITAALAPDDISLALLYHGRGPISEVLGDFEGARSDLETALNIARQAGDDMLVWRILLDLGNLWTSRDYDAAGDYYEKALELARRLDDHQILARSLNRMGNWNANAEHPQQAITFHREALEIIERLDDPPGLANTLDLLGMANLLAGNFSDAHYYIDRAVALYRELDDRFRLAGSLTTRRAGVTYNDLTIAQPTEVMHAAGLSANEALNISKEIGWLAGESFALWVLSLNTALLGKFGEALAMVQRGLNIATVIDHRQWMAGHEFVYGVLYCDILASNKAQHHSERALELARETGSQYWTNQAAGALARAYLLQGDLARCGDTLSSVLSPSTPMDSHAKRYCWLHRAELALGEEEPQLALDIITRLIAAVPGLTGNVIPTLWRLHAETLAAVGQGHEAESILQVALKHVPRGHPHRWRLYAVMGDLYWQTDRQSEAEEAYKAGRTDVNTLAATISDEQLHENFQQRAYDRLSPPSSGK